MCRAAGTVKYTRRDVEAGADLVFHVGDVSYADGREYVWNSFMNAIEPAASRVPYMVAVGDSPPLHPALYLTVSAALPISKCVEKEAERNQEAGIAGPVHLECTVSNIHLSGNCYLLPHMCVSV